MGDSCYRCGISPSHYNYLVQRNDRLAQAEALLQEVWWDCQHIDARERIRVFLSDGGSHE